MTEKRGARNLTDRSQERPQVRPTAEGWTQNVDADGRPTLQFEQPKRGAKPPVHLADLTPEEREAFVKSAGRYYVESLLRNEQAVRRAFESGGRESAQKIINNISTKANKRAKKELGLD